MIGRALCELYFFSFSNHLTSANTLTFSIFLFLVCEVSFFDTPVPLENKLTLDTDDFMLDMNLHRSFSTAVASTSMLKTVLGNLRIAHADCHHIDQNYIV